MAGWFHLYSGKPAQAYLAALEQESPLHPPAPKRQVWGHLKDQPKRAFIVNPFIYYKTTLFTSTLLGPLPAGVKLQLSKGLGPQNQPDSLSV